MKNALVGTDRNVVRKARELVVSAKMARQWSKDEILGAYLNTIYFGRNAYGIAQGSRAFFDKPVEELTLAEGAVLASVIQSPSLLDPATDPDALRERWNYVLDGMVEMGVLAATERAATQFPEVLPVAPPNPDDVAPGPEGLIRTRVAAELEAAGVSEQDLNTGGLQITTTIDAKAQQAAVEAVDRTLSKQPDQLRASVVSIDPRSGAIRAYYGGADGTGYDFAQAPLQTGSSFKVFAAIAALQDKIPLSAQYSSAPLTVGGLTVENVEGETCGTCSLAEALKRSLNTSYYRLTLSMEDGARKIADSAHQAGIPKQIPGLEHETLTQAGGPPETGIVLGQYQTRPSTWRRRMRRSRRRAGSTSRIWCRKWWTRRDGCCSIGNRTTVSSGWIRRSPMPSRRRWCRSPGTRVTTDWPVDGRRPPRPEPRSWATPARTRTPGWSVSRRRCPPRCGSGPPTERPSKPVGAARSTDPGCRRTSGRRRWTGP
ncbi:hypothetical protein GS433_25325 [Rhodococcus hoagii]|nr:hypothetical protein [Prescottella equi]